MFRSLLRNRRKDIGWEPAIVRIIDRYATKTPGGYRWYASGDPASRDREYVLYDVTGDACWVVFHPNSRNVLSTRWLAERLVPMPGAPFPQEIGPFDTDAEAISRVNAQFR